MEKNTNESHLKKQNKKRYQINTPPQKKAFLYSEQCHL